MSQEDISDFLEQKERLTIQAPDAPDLSAFQDDSNLDDIRDQAEWIALEDAALTKLKKDLVARKDILDEAKENIARIFKSKGIKSHKFDSGLSPCRSTATKYYVNSDTEQEQVCQWFEDNGLGENVKRSVNFQTMNSVLNERVEAGESIPNGLVDFTERDSLKMNGKSKFLKANPLSLNLPEIRIKNGNIEIK